MIAVVALVPARARAQPSTDAQSRADALFREGQELLAAGQVATACAKLEESERLDPALGRLLNLAYCHQQLGRTATAYNEFNEAAALATQKGDERQGFARAQASALAPKLSFVRLDLGRAAEVSEVRVDGERLGRQEWVLPFPIDPGPHTLSFGAPRHKPHDQSVMITAPGIAAVVVEALEPEATEPTPQGVPQPPLPAVTLPAPPVASAGAGSSRTFGWVVGAAGVVALGVGTGFALDAMSLKSQADALCPNKLCTPHGKSLIDDASTAATIATIGFAVGIVGIGAGAWLVLRPTSNGGARAALQGRW
jgi:hypothetical protein